MYAISFLLAAFLIGSIYVITSSTMYDPPDSNDDGGEGLQPMPPTLSGPSGSIRYKDAPTDGAPADATDEVLA